MKVLSKNAILGTILAFTSVCAIGAEVSYETLNIGGIKKSITITMDDIRDNIVAANTISIDYSSYACESRWSRASVVNAMATPNVEIYGTIDFGDPVKRQFILDKDEAITLDRELAFYPECLYTGAINISINEVLNYIWIHTIPLFNDDYTEVEISCQDIKSGAIKPWRQYTYKGLPTRSLKRRLAHIFLENRKVVAAQRSCLEAVINDRFKDGKISLEATYIGVTEK